MSHHDFPLVFYLKSKRGLSYEIRRFELTQTNIAYYQEKGDSKELRFSAELLNSELERDQKFPTKLILKSTDKFSSN